MGQTTIFASRSVESDRSWIFWALFWPFCIVMSGVGWYQNKYQPFKPGDDLGYYIGLVGALLMLSLLLYPLRKHWRLMQGWGSLKNWFRVHMILGIIGPTLVMIHSTFHLHSANAAVATVCMSLVAWSGVIGRFFYTRIHYGIWGRRATLRELQDGLNHRRHGMHAELSFSPEVEAQILQFEEYATKPKPAWAAFWRLLTLSHRAQYVYVHCRTNIKRGIRQKARESGWSVAQSRMRYGLITRLVKDYLDGVREMVTFKVFEKVFSYWHLLHVPLVILLLLSGIAHVIAVHMY